MKDKSIGKVVVDNLQKIKEQILTALKHPEAEDGLYFRNLFHLHEEDERQPVLGREPEILDALGELVKEGKVRMDENNGEMIFMLV